VLSQKALKSTELLERHLRKNGRKLTRQRQMIAELFLRKDHVTVEDLYREVSRKNSGIGMTTVYRTLKLLCQWGIGQERHFSNAKTIYDNVAWKRHHDHLICTQCGKIIEFENLQIELLQKKVADRHQFLIVHHKLELYGICGDCRRREA
jgi:Fur family ferric uptake transcriptional regulator